MPIRDNECEELKQLYLEQEGVELTVDEAREILSKLVALVERFAAWSKKDNAAEKSELVAAE